MRDWAIQLHPDKVNAAVRITSGDFGLFQVYQLAMITGSSYPGQSPMKSSRDSFGRLD
jgi:hypothetical protein